MEKTTVKYDSKNILVILIVAVLVVLFAILASLVFNLNLVQSITMSWVLTTVYSLFAFFTLDNKVIRQTERIVERPVEVIREVIREVPIQIPMENNTVEVVEKIVTREVPVYIRSEKIRKKISVPRDNYLASSETKRYHTKSCKFGKLIKTKYKIHNNRLAFFKKKHFKACKMCINKTKQN